METMEYDGFKSIRNIASGDSHYFVNFLENPKQIFEEIINEVNFLPRSALTFKIYGKTLELPRDKQFYGDVEEDGSYPLYRYGGSYYPVVNPWTATLLKIRKIVNEKTDQLCNHLVVNRYLNGSDHIGLHKDKVRDFTPGTSVMTISLGIPRLFRLKNVTTRETVDIVLQPGSMFQLGPKTNDEWKHSIVKRAISEVSGVRISLTYRSIHTVHHPENEEKKKVEKREIENVQEDDHNRKYQKIM